jgi:hypothetical protein
MKILLGPSRTFRLIVATATLALGTAACAAPEPGAGTAPAPAPLVATAQPTPVLRPDSPLATGAVAASAAPAGTVAATARPAPPPTPTAQQLTDIFPATPAPSPAPLPAAGQLVQVLAIADAEMRAAQSSPTLAGARAHAEVAVNVLVGYWGRGYGDGDGDGKLDDPTDGYGVLPAGRVQEAAPDTRAARQQVGWALDVYQAGSPAVRQEVDRFILGDATAWHNRPFAQYDRIDAAVAASASTGGKAIAQLAGPVPRAVAWARLILAQAANPAEAQSYAARAAAETGTALQAARRIAGEAR